MRDEGLAEERGFWDFGIALKLLVLLLGCAAGLQPTGLPFCAVGDGIFLDVEADLSWRLVRLGRFHELADGVKEGTDGSVMAFDALLEFS